ncbi:RidA family protein [Georgenia faecalis]|uniref:RidA family protein n=1 Tax=Georgenia faecalis TaxID=2483799 RepID=A0ABV9D8B4_9MICO|nr:Rid family detoxifying hydrolase [Georgenia faecalis]
MPTTITTPDAPSPAGAYSQGVRAHGTVVAVSGQVGLDPATGELVTGIDAQTRQALANVEAVLRAAGASLADVVKTTCFLTDLSYFAEFNAVYREVLGEAFPARSTVGVGLAPGMLVEIEALAVVADPSAGA